MVKMGERRCREMAVSEAAKTISKSISSTGTDSNHFQLVKLQQLKWLLAKVKAKVQMQINLENLCQSEK